MTCARCGKTVTVQVPDGWIAYCSRDCAYAAWDEQSEPSSAVHQGEGEGQ